MRILVAEDDTMPRKMLVKTLELWGYEVQQATNGREAIELFKQSPSQLVITDWNMPDCDGLELCRWVREQKDLRYTYLILLTSRSDRESLVEALGAGADDFVGKPFDADELRARIRAGERILALSHELARRLEQLVQANDKIRKLNEQLTTDVRSLMRALNQWSEGHANDTQASPAEMQIREALSNDLRDVIDQWVSSLVTS